MEYVLKLKMQEWSCHPDKKFKQVSLVQTHCYGHALNFEVNDCIRKVEVLKDAWVVIEGSALSGQDITFQGN